MKPFLVWLFLTASSSLIVAQELNNNFQTPVTSWSSDTSKLFLSIDNLNFVKNDEYFGELTSGITYIGTFLQPKLEYRVHKNIIISGGIHLLKYSGLDQFTQVLPVFSIDYLPYQDVSFTLGSIKSGANHRMLEPLYAFENHLINNVENGAQLRISKPKLFIDVWLNWEKFIFKTSMTQESILGGITAQYQLNKTGSFQTWLIDLQTIFAHKGGQFHTEKDVLQTINNSAAGLKWRKKNADNTNQLSIAQYYLTFADPSPIPQYPYLMGYGLLSEVSYRYRNMFLQLAYWNGTYFISALGNTLFESVSDKSDFVQPYQQMLTAKIAYQKTLYKDIKLEARFEPYYDLTQRQFEFSYGLYIMFNTNFFLMNTSGRNKIR